MSTQPSSMPVPTPPKPAIGDWARYFGYDIFISFALGPPPRGCRAYASDLARRLRELGFTVFFSEDEAPVGSVLDETLKRALAKSRVLIVVANRGTLLDPRWVRAEVEEYRARRSSGVIASIDVGKALQDPQLASEAGKWLQHEGRIWADEDEAACLSGKVSDDVVVRLATAPHSLRSRARLTIVLAGTVSALALLAALAWAQRNAAVDQRDRAHAALLSASAQQALLLSRDGRAHEGWALLVDTLAEANPKVAGPLPQGFLQAALTTLVEDRRGPALEFDQGAIPSIADESDVAAPAYAFNSDGTKVAAAAGEYVAVWLTSDGRRLVQVRLPFQARQLTFAARDSVIVAEGRTVVRADNDGETREGPPQAAAIDILGGTVHPLPLALCERRIPCIGNAGASQLAPLHMLPDLRALQAGALDGTRAYFASAAGSTRTLSVSIKRFVLLEHEQDAGPPRHLLLDRVTKGILPLDVRHDRDEFTDYTLAAGHDMLVASSRSSPHLAVFRVIPGTPVPQLRDQRLMKARQSAATQGVQLDRHGAVLRYQTFRYGTGTGVGIGRTAVIDLESRREQWSRDEGAVVWGSALVALKENWNSIQVMSAETGATLFTAPGFPVGFDPDNRMLLAWDGEKSPWPRLHLLETLPVRQFSRDQRDPASIRSSCPAYNEMTFRTLSERSDRIWNKEDWHRSATRVHSGPVPATVQVAAVPDEQSLTTLDRTEAARLFPQLASVLKEKGILDVLLTTSPDKRWQGVLVQLDGESTVANCRGIALWQVYRAGASTPLRSGCTPDEYSSGPGFTPRIHFFANGGKSAAVMLAALPADLCKYDIVELANNRLLTSARPAFANNVTFQPAGNDLFLLTSTDWYEATHAYQLQATGPEGAGPVLLFADRNGGDLEAGEVQTMVRSSEPLYLTDPFSASGGDVAIKNGANELEISDPAQTITLGIPPWGERLRERLRLAVQRRK